MITAEHCYTQQNFHNESELLTYLIRFCTTEHLGNRTDKEL